MPDADLKILIVDDYSNMRKVTKSILRDMGYPNVLEAENGEAALEVLQSEPVDLVLTDWNMPVMNGLEFLKAVRGDEKLKELPILMITADGMSENIKDAVKAGITNFIVKPFSIGVLEEKVKSILKD